MSAPPTTALAEPIEPAPYSARLAARRLHAVARPSPTERRLFPRHPVADLQWLQSARLRHGPAVSLIDISRGGALLDAECPLRPGARLVLELEANGSGLRVPVQVLRSQISRLHGEMALYRAACAFAEPVDLRSLGYSPGARRQPAFVGIDAALGHLLDRCLKSGEGERPGHHVGVVALEPREVLYVLESLQARVVKPGADGYARGVAVLLSSVLPALHRGEDADGVIARIEHGVRRLIGVGDSSSATSHRDLQVVARAGASSGGGWQEPLVRTADLLKELVARLNPTAESTPSEPAPRTQAAHPGQEAAQDVSEGSAWQKIVVRYRGGEIIKGFTHDFHSSRGHFSLWPSITAPKSDRVVVPMARLKAVFFVRDFDGDPEYVERKCFEAGAGAGRRIEVAFVDREVIHGTTLNYRPDGYGFFVIPQDPLGNNRRVFVVSAAVRHVRFP